MSAFSQHLPEVWQHWLHDNLQRGCDPDQLLDTLRQNGFGDLMDQTAAQLTAHGGQLPDRPYALLAEPIRRLGRNQLEPCDGLQPRIRLQLSQPVVVLLDGVLTGAECEALIALAQPQLQSSTVVEDQGGGAVLDQRRSSVGTGFPRRTQVLADQIERRIGQWLDYPVERLEGMQVLCYQPGGEYRAHFDFFDPALGGSARHLAKGGQRVLTVVLYLSDVAAGGGTSFPELGLTIQPHRGSALCFINVQAEGTPDRRTLHAGLPVIEGTKYIATLWWRERDYTSAD